MNTIKKPENKINLPLRHSASVKEAVDALAEDKNLTQSVHYRQIFNAGLEAMYGFKLKNNQIINS